MHKHTTIDERTGVSRPRRTIDHCADCPARAGDDCWSHDDHFTGNCPTCGQACHCPPLAVAPLDRMVLAIAEAMQAYDASGDHKHAGGPYPGDCLRCALRPFERFIP